MSQQPSIVRYLDSENKLLAFGARLAQVLQPGLYIALRGNLGAGKTTLVRGIMHALGHTGPVRSPTYTLVESYDLSGLHLYHFDFYRFSDPEEWAEGGLRDYFSEENICLVEWPEMAEGLPEPDLQVTLKVHGEGRELTLTPGTPAGSHVIQQLQPTEEK